MTLLPRRRRTARARPASSSPDPVTWLPTRDRTSLLLAGVLLAVGGLLPRLYAPVLLGLLALVVHRAAHRGTASAARWAAVAGPVGVVPALLHPGVATDPVLVVSWVVALGVCVRVVGEVVDRRTEVLDRLQRVDEAMHALDYVTHAGNVLHAVQVGSELAVPGARATVRLLATDAALRAEIGRRRRGVADDRLDPAAVAVETREPVHRTVVRGHLLVVPMRSGGRPIGALELVLPGPVDDADVAVAGLWADRAAMTIAHRAARPPTGGRAAPDLVHVRS